MIRLSALAVYPVKSCRGTWCRQAVVGPRGLEHDREWMVVDADGRFLTQRTLPRLATVAVELTRDALRLSVADLGAVAVPLGERGAPRQVTVWRDRVAAESAGAAAAELLSELAGAPCELVRLPPDSVRPVDPARGGAGHQVGFADAFPFLLLSEASLAELNRRLAKPVPMDRFRPNLVVAGCGPHAEDGWAELEVGGIRLECVAPCARCIITTTDQRTGERFREPLATLAGYRRVDGKVLFGQNLVHHGRGVLTVGDECRVVDRP